MAKYNNRAVARKLEQLSRVRRETPSGLQMWANGFVPDLDSAGATVQALSTSTSYFLPIHASPLRIKAAGVYVSDFTAGTMYARLYKLEKATRSGEYINGSSPICTYTLTAVSNKATATPDLASYSGPATFTFDEEYFLDTARNIYVLGITSTFAGNIYCVTEEPQVLGTYRSSGTELPSEVSSSYIAIVDKTFAFFLLSDTAFKAFGALN